MTLNCPTCKHSIAICLAGLRTAPVFVQCQMCGQEIEITTEKLVRIGPTETKEG